MSQSISHVHQLLANIVEEYLLSTCDVFFPPALAGLVSDYVISSDQETNVRSLIENQKYHRCTFHLDVSYDIVVTMQNGKLALYSIAPRFQGSHFQFFQEFQNVRSFLRFVIITTSKLFLNNLCS